jgi:hypothetical protein
MPAVKGKKCGGKRPGAGRPKGSTNKGAPEQRRTFTELALDYTVEALETLVTIMRYGESESARVSACSHILDRALGKAPQHVDVLGIKHTEIVYRSADEVRRGLLAQGVPARLLELHNAALEKATDDLGSILRPKKPEKHTWRR